MPSSHKIANKFANQKLLNCECGTAIQHTGTGLVERTIQSMKNLILANLEDDTSLRENVNRALPVLRLTTHSDTKKTLFEIHFVR